MTIVIDGTTGISGVDGTASNPSYEGTDSNTGIFFPAADTVAIGTGGTERLRVDSAGNMGLAVTPTNNTLGRTLSVGQSAVLTSETADNRFWLGSNWTYNSSADRYIANGYATLYGQQSGQHQWFTAASGTAGGTITFTQAMTLDASGNLGIGTTDPSGYSFDTGVDLVVGNGTNSAIFVVSSTTGTGYLAFADGTSGLDRYRGLLEYSHTDNFLGFRTNAVERARITSGGDFLVGKTSNADSVVGSMIRGTGYITSTWAETTNAITTYHVYSTGTGGYRFYVGLGGTVFAVSTTISAVSDQRLKENIQDLDVGLDAVMALKPRKFDWKEGQGKDIKGDRGFIAQEFETVFPDLIDEWRDPAPEGEEPYKSVRQDLIPVLVKAIQEQQAMIEEMKAEIAALKAQP